MAMIQPNDTYIYDNIYLLPVTITNNNDFPVEILAVKKSFFGVEIEFIEHEPES